MMTTGDIYFRTAPSGTANNQITWEERMFIDQSSGLVGVGTTGPSQKLHVHGGHILITGGPSTAALTLK